MGTKNNPGDYDCYANAEPDEPMFVLLGRDRMAPALVQMWANAREGHGEVAEKVEEARVCARQMEAYLFSRNKTPFSIGGDFTSQAAAWLAIVDLCVELGMKTEPERQESGIQKVRRFITTLAEKATGEAERER